MTCPETARPADHDRMVPGSAQGNSLGGLAALQAAERRAEREEHEGH